MRFSLTGRTGVVCILGDPIAHSLSPVMQNAALQEAAIDAVYVPFHVTAVDLEASLDGLRRMNIIGGNLTIPHKEAAMPFVDRLDDDARVIGSINTIVNRNGELIGYNTDGSGLLQALYEDLDFDVKGKKVLLLGSGGACRAAVVALGRAGADWVGIANRTEDRAAKLLSGVAKTLLGTTFAHYHLDEGLAERLPHQVDLLINTTSVGMTQDAFAFPVENYVRPGGGVYDMVYGREETPLVRKALLSGLHAADGLGMLAAQGELAFNLWFGQKPTFGLMKKILRETCSA